MDFINPEIFREYDIRGIAGKDLDTAKVERIGQAIGTYLGGKGAVAVGGDVRISTPEYQAALVRGLLSTGMDVIDVGTVPTPALYFAVFTLDTVGGVMVTASHNPGEFNGFKILKGHDAVFGEGIQAIERLANGHALATGKGQYSTRDVIGDYQKTIRQKITLARRLKVVMDCGNGTAGAVAPALVRALGCDLEVLYAEADGRFPHHLPDPTKPELMQTLIQKVRATRADIGIGYDGDSDRLGLVDEQGNMVWGDQILGLLAKDLLQRRPQAKIIFEVKCSQALPEFIRRHNGVPIMWKTGHSLIKDKMKQTGAPLAGEMSGHLFLGEDYFGFDDAIYASAKFLQILAAANRPLSHLVREIPAYTATPEIRVDCPDAVKFGIVAKLVQYFKPRYPESIDIDGIRIAFPDGAWALVRASNTQPKLILRFEASSAARLREIKNVLLEQLALYPAVRTDGIGTYFS